MRYDDDPNSANEYILTHRTSPAIYIHRRTTAEGDVRIDIMGDERLYRCIVGSRGEGGEGEIVSAAWDDDKRGGLEGFREVIRRTRHGVFKPRVVTMANADNLPAPPLYAPHYLTVPICSSTLYPNTITAWRFFFTSVDCVISCYALRA